MMVYYQVYYIDKTKCRFSFSYIRNEYEEIQGVAAAILRKPCYISCFDPKSGQSLNDNEKHGIVSLVLKHITL